MINLTRPNASKAALLVLKTTTIAAAIAFCSINAGFAADANFSPANPFFAPSTLPFQAPPFDKIKSEDFEPAIEAGMAQQQDEIQRIADNHDAPSFENTIVAMEKSGQLLRRVTAVFSGITGANTNDILQKVRTIEAPKLAAHRDFIFLNTKLFGRVDAIYKQRATLKLDAESLRLVEQYHDDFIHAGANLSEADKNELRKLNEELSSLSTAFSNKLLAATKAGAYVTANPAALEANAVLPSLQ